LLVLLALLLPCIPAGLRAQTTGSQEVSTRSVEPTFKLQAERNMVTVRVVVRNGKGEAVDNLRKEDFQVFDRGKRQTIGQFSVDKPTTEAIETPTQKSVEKTALPEPSAEKTPSAVALPRRFVALYFDDVNTGFSGLVRSRDASYRFLQTSLHPGDRVGVFTASTKNSLDFTDDLARVNQALADLRPNPIIARDENCGAITPYEAYYIVVIKGLMFDQNDPIERLVGAEKQSCRGLPGNSAASENSSIEALRVKSESDMRAMATLRGLESLTRFMSTLPGQRSIVFVSDGFQSQTLGYTITQISERALHADIIINALDARGLYVGGFTSDASVAGRDLPQEADVRELKRQVMEEEALRASEAMGTLAQDTGGIFFENNNDLEAGLRRVAGTPETSYTLAFSPENLKHDGAFHGLKVTLVSGKGLNVQARKGYYAPKKSEDLAAQEKEDLQDAVFSQSERQGLPIEVNTQFFMINASDAEIGVVTHVDLQQIHFRKEADRNVHTLTFVTAIFDRDGHYVAGQQKVLELRLRDASLEQFLRNGIKVKSDLKVKPGVYLLRSVVRDSESGQISAVNSTMEIPY
jgi:VWFA-related protein